MWVSNLPLVIFILGSTHGISQNDFNSAEFFLRKIQPFLSESNIEISIKCRSHLAHYVNGLTSKKLWALKMFDAAAKIPDGILGGNLVELGSFDECLRVEGHISDSTTVLGKYCLGALPISNGPKQSTKQLTRSVEMMFLMHQPKALELDLEIAMQLASCMPEACTASEIQKVYAAVGLPVTFTEDLCQSKASQPELNAGGIAALSFFGVILWMMIASTSYDVILMHLHKKPAHSLLISFSVLTNGRKLMATSDAKSQISCIHGIRVITTMWVIIGHRYSTQMSFPIKNSLYIIEWMQHRVNMFMMGATVSVDTFFLMAGLVISYIYMNTVTKGVKFNIILYYLHRYLRLTPALAVVILIHATLLQYLGSGPLWLNRVYPMIIDSCKDAWWKALIYFQNYGELNVCVPQTWYLSVDTQLFVLSPILLIPLSRWPKVTLSATGFLTICSILTCFLTAWFLELNAALMGNSEDKLNHYLKYYYMATQTRAAPWFIGIILGYYVYQAKKSKTVNINMLTVAVLWMVALAVICTCVFAGHDLYFSEYNRVANSFHIALVRPAWSVAVGWVIFACATGLGGPVNWFLSLPIFQVGSKLTYSLYLVHYTVIFIATAQMRRTPIVSNSREMYVFWGDFVCTLFFAIVLTLAFESPIIVIEKWVFGTGTEKKSTSEIAVKSDKKHNEIA